ncbi:single-stranded DNA-binding protein [Clostridiales Family XIII bacterium ASD5510]|uniref:Single-stranded DNA-binding protein n=1 Tax=Hominibacterium faecale TaxID=2839743 RepID=A0A9J6QSB6_9FIRM|nr:single-stranded DNA-binding protein [Hominibacterium faecale]MCU7378901.1 single-stranded DNA-binding protein [Hominibacterium faecale]
MKQIISGKLAKTPTLKKIPNKEGGEERVANFTIFVFDPNAPRVERPDGSTYRKGIPFHCTAWGENADYVAGKKAGEQLTASATVRYNEYPRKDGSKLVEANYVIKRIDPQNEIQKQMSSLLAGYEDGQYHRIDQREAQPEFRDFDKGRGQPKPMEQERAQDNREPEQEQKTLSAQEQFQKDAMQQSHNGAVNVEKEQKGRES